MKAGRQYEIYHDNEPADAFGDFRAFIELWRSKSPVDGLPAWSNFQFEDFTGWYGQLSLLKLEDDGRVHVTLWGTQLVNWWGVDLTNRDLVDHCSKHSNYWSEGEGVYVRQLVRNPGIGRWLGTLEHVERGFIVIEAIDLSLNSNDGITHILSAYMNRCHDWTDTPLATPRERF